MTSIARTLDFEFQSTRSMNESSFFSLCFVFSVCTGFCWLYGPRVE